MNTLGSPRKVECLPARPRRHFETQAEFIVTGVNQAPQKNRSRTARRLASVGVLACGFIAILGIERGVMPSTVTGWIMPTATPAPGGTSAARMPLNEAPAPSVNPERRAAERQDQENAAMPPPSTDEGRAPAVGVTPVPNGPADEEAFDRADGTPEQAQTGEQRQDAASGHAGVAVVPNPANGAGREMSEQVPDPAKTDGLPDGKAPRGVETKAANPAVVGSRKVLLPAPGLAVYRLPHGNDQAGGVPITESWTVYDGWAVACETQAALKSCFASGYTKANAATVKMKIGAAAHVAGGKQEGGIVRGADGRPNFVMTIEAPPGLDEGAGLSVVGTGAFGILSLKGSCGANACVASAFIDPSRDSLVAAGKGGEGTIAITGAVGDRGYVWRLDGAGLERAVQRMLVEMDGVGMTSTATPPIRKPAGIKPPVGGAKGWQKGRAE